MTAPPRGRGKRTATDTGLETTHPGKEIRVATTEAFLTREQVANRLQLAVGTIANWASAGIGPKCIRFANGRVRYPVEDYFEWERTQTQT